MFVVMVGNSERLRGGGTVSKSHFTFFTAWLPSQLLYKERYGTTWPRRKQL